MEELRMLSGDIIFLRGHLGIPNEFRTPNRDTARGVDALFILTEWKEFRSPNFQELKHRMKSPIIFDGRNLYEPHLVRDRGFEYWAIGRP